MSKLDQKIIWIVVVALAVLSALGVVYVRQKQDSAAVNALSARFVDLSTLGFACDDEGVTVETAKDVLAAKDALAIAWPERQNEEVIVASQAMPCHSKQYLQLDLYVGGAQNAEGQSRSGYRVWLEATLLRGDESVKTESVELPLESDKQRARQYSLRVSYDGLAPDAYRLAFRVEPLHGAIAAGTLDASYLEVIER